VGSLIEPLGLPKHRQAGRPVSALNEKFESSFSGFGLFGRICQLGGFLVVICDLFDRIATQLTRGPHDETGIVAQGRGQPQ